MNKLKKSASMLSVLAASMAISLPAMAGNADLNLIWKGVIPTSTVAGSDGIYVIDSSATGVLVGARAISFKNENGQISLGYQGNTENSFNFSVVKDSEIGDGGYNSLIDKESIPFVLHKKAFKVYVGEESPINNLELTLKDSISNEDVTNNDIEYDAGANANIIVAQKTPGESINVSAGDKISAEAVFLISTVENYF